MLFLGVGALGIAEDQNMVLREGLPDLDGDWRRNVATEVEACHLGGDRTGKPGDREVPRGFRGDDVHGLHLLPTLQTHADGGRGATRRAGHWQSILLMMQHTWLLSARRRQGRSRLSRKGLGEAALSSN